MAETNTMMMVPFEDIEIGLFKNTRQAFRKIPELMDSLVRHGQIEPVVVLYKHYGGNGYTRPDTGEKVTTRKILVCGDRRMEAMRRLREKHPGKFDKVKCSLWHGTETDARFLKLAENIDRDDLNPVEVADGILELVNCEVDRGDIADRLGYTRGYVTMLLSIRTQCSPNVLRALSEGKITIDTARDFSKLFTHAEQDKALAKHLGIQKEKGKATAKRETKKDTGGKSRPALKKLKQVFGEVASLQRKAGEKDTTRSEWIGACRAIECAMGDDEDMLDEAEKIVERLRKTEKKNAPDDDAEE